MARNFFGCSAGSQSDASTASEKGVMHLANSHRGTNANTTSRVWHGTAFMLEVVIILLCIAVGMAVLCSAFVKSYQLDQQADVLTQAVTLASVGAENGAEAFEADPTDADCPAQTIYSYDGVELKRVETYVPGAYVVRRTVKSDETGGGKLYRATIDVSRYNETVYSLSVATYKSAGRGGGGQQ